MAMMPMPPPSMAAAAMMPPPLEPRPMPDQTINPETTTRNSIAGGDTRRFECAICYEYMEDPFGCGNSACSSRFCRPCLHRVLHQSSATIAASSDDGRSDGPPPSDSAKCPNCRSFFAAGSISADDGLRDEMRDCDITVTCPFRGCGATLKIADLASHEASCIHVRMMCKYADWGCDWVGRRYDLAYHDGNECDFRGGLGVLTERFRQRDSSTRRAMQQHHARIGSLGQMLTLHSRQIAMSRARNPWNVLDVLSLTYEASLFPGKSAMRGAQREARAVISNMLLLLPSLAVAFNVSDGIEFVDTGKKLR